MPTNYFLQPCYYYKGKIGWVRQFDLADFFAVYSGEPWGSYQFISGWETPAAALSEIQRLLATPEDVGQPSELAPPFPANPQLGEIENDNEKTPSAA